MRIQYIPKGSPDSPLILIFGKDPAEFEALAKELTNFAKRSEGKLVFNTLPGFQNDRDITLSAHVTKEDVVIKRNSHNSRQFNCSLTRSHWQEIAGKTTAFVLVATLNHPGTEYLVKMGKIKLLVQERWKVESILLSGNGSAVAGIVQCHAA